MATRQVGMNDAYEDYNPFSAEETRSTKLVSVCASEIAIEPVEWIWPGRLAVGKHTCIAGEPGASKSQLTMHVGATISTAGPWPCGEGKAPIGAL